MVKCLRCGWCCTSIYPGNRNDEKEIPEPCPELQVEGNGLTRCGIYPNRPKQCQDEHMGAEEWEPCPIGLIAVENGKVPRPTGKCMNCGGFTYGNTFCTDTCERDFVKSLG